MKKNKDEILSADVCELLTRIEADPRISENTKGAYRTNPDLKHVKKFGDGTVMTVDESFELILIGEEMSRAAAQHYATSTQPETPEKNNQLALVLADIYAAARKYVLFLYHGDVAAAKQSPHGQHINWDV
jgi:uncharacterized protein (DUF1684 family)